MSKAILNNDVIDVIYDSICGYSLEEAYKILEDHRRGRYISKEWIKKWLTKQTIPALHTCDYYEAVDMMLDDWEKENGKVD